MSTPRARRKRRIKLNRSSNGMFMTPEEYETVTDWDELYRYELVHGVLIVSRLGSPSETGPNLWLAHLFLRYQDEHPQGSTLDDVLYEWYLEVPNGRRRTDTVAWAGLGRLPTYHRGRLRIPLDA